MNNRCTNFHLLKKPSEIEILQLLKFIGLQSKVKSIEGYQAILTEIKKYSLPFPVITLKKGEYLFRARAHEKGEEYFNLITELGPRLDNNNIRSFGRANEPFQSIFYCSDSYDVAFFETSVIARKQVPLPIEIITIGRWVLKEDVNVVCLVGDKKLKGLNKTVDRLQEEFSEVFKKIFIKRLKIFSKLMEIFSLEFTKDAQNDPSNYIISCAVANYVYSIERFIITTETEFQPKGILYPSFMHNGGGVNYAFLPELIEEHVLVLDQVIRKKLIKVDETTYKDDNYNTAKFVDYNSGTIFW